jgi:hypothetical protein
MISASTMAATTMTCRLEKTPSSGSGNASIRDSPEALIILATALTPSTTIALAIKSRTKVEQ